MTFLLGALAVIGFAVILTALAIPVLFFFLPTFLIIAALLIIGLIELAGLFEPAERARKRIKREHHKRIRRKHGPDPEQAMFAAQQRAEQYREHARWWRRHGGVAAEEMAHYNYERAREEQEKANHAR